MRTSDRRQLVECTGPGGATENPRSPRGQVFVRGVKDKKTGKCECAIPKSPPRRAIYASPMPRGPRGHRGPQQAILRAGAGFGLRPWGERRETGEMHAPSPKSPLQRAKEPPSKCHRAATQGGAPHRAVNLSPCSHPVIRWQRTRKNFPSFADNFLKLSTLVSG